MFQSTIHNPQSTHPRGVRRLTFGLRPDPPSFNPRTREGCDALIIASKKCPVCFNPRTREGCDDSDLVTAWFCFGFNPRTREGCDGISTPVLVQTREFQSTHPRGVRRPKRMAWTGSKKLFQSTHPRGVRPSLHFTSMPPFGFNPRTREGCD